MIKITSDSSVDLTPELLKKYNFSTLPFNILMDEKDYRDGIDINNEMIIDNFNKNHTLPKTSAVSIETYKDFFKQFTDNGDEVIHFSLSGEMSCSCANAITASEENGHTTVIDGKNLSTGTALLMIYANELKEKGLSVKEIKEKVEKRIPFVQSSFVIDKLNFLYKGGRCSSLQLLGANVLGIKPSIVVKDGKMGMDKKYMGKLIKVAEKYVLDTLNKYNTPDLSRCFITYSTIEPDVLEMVKTTLQENAKFKEVLITNAGATVTSHCGANTIGVLYLNDGGENGLNN